MLVKQGKLFTNSELIKSCLIVAAKDCPEKINSLKTISLSARIVAQRAENIGNRINSKFKKRRQLISSGFSWL